jgi:hypothetical protein
MADIGEPLRRITVVPLKHPAPGIEDPNPVVIPAEPAEPVPAEPVKEPVKEPV